jgi:SAM-dependent methyltransferase
MTGPEASSPHANVVSENVEVNRHYDAKYFDWHREIGAFGAWVDAHKFQKSVSSGDTVIDFGCGGGFLLHELNCRRRIGIEPNPSAAESVKFFGIEHFFNSADALHALGEEVVDVVISTNALEHTSNPLQEIRNLYPLLKAGGIAHFIVPCDSISNQWIPGDINQHFFSWSPMNLGNLFTYVGFRVDFVAPYIHKWPRYYNYVSKLGWPLFNLACRIYGQIERSSFQVEIKARKPGRVVDTLG